MIRTPLQTEDVPVLASGGEPCLHEDVPDDGEEDAAPIYPSQKLGAVTRKRNEISKYLKIKIMKISQK